MFKILPTVKTQFVYFFLKIIAVPRLLTRAVVIFEVLVHCTSIYSPYNNLNCDDSPANLTRIVTLATLLH